MAVNDSALWVARSSAAMGASKFITDKTDFDYLGRKKVDKPIVGH